MRLLAIVAVAGVLGSACMEKLASRPRPSLEGCGGLFTTVALPIVTRDEEQALQDAVPPLTARDFNLRLRRNYYRIVYEEGPDPSVSRDTFVARMLAEEQTPPGLLAGVELRALKFAIEPTPERRRALRQAVLHAREPLEQRLHRVATRMVSASGRPDVTCRLDARMRLNAGAEVRFRSREVLVGPSLVLLAESEDALAFVIGHELAHITHHHTLWKAMQNLLVRTFTLGYGRGATAEALVGILSQGALPAFNRDKECEADYYALRFMRDAGYRPEGAVAFWREVFALRARNTRHVVPFVSGRPPEAERVLRLARWAGVDLLRDRAADPIPDDAPAAQADAIADADLSPDDVIESFGVVLQ